MSTTTSTQANVETVQQIYAAFGRGDVAAILGHVTDNVEWDNSATSAGEVPWNGNFSGRGQLPGFFAALAEHADFKTFEPRDFVSGGNHVVVRLHIEVVVRRSGARIENDVVHFWTFDPSGKVSAYRHFNDTGAELAAWRG